MRRLALRLAIVVVTFLIASVGFFVALAFGVVGIYFLFAQFLGPTWAAFATAASAILFSLAVIGMALFFTRSGEPRRRRKLDGSDPSYLAAMVGNLLGRRFEKYAGAHRQTSIFASFAAGFAVGASSKLRAFLFDLVRS